MVDTSAPNLARRALAELVGTAFLLAAVVGGGIAASELAPAEPAIALLVAAVVTGAALTALILAVGPVSGAHLNPAVSLAARLLGGLDNRELAAYAGAQVGGGVLGVVVANLMFDLPAITVATTVRGGGGPLGGEVVATLGLVVVIFAMVRAASSVAAIAGAVGTYIAAAHFFTSSTSFANPAVTIARTLSDTYAGIAPASVAGFVAAQIAGTVLAVAVVRAMLPDVGEIAEDIVVPHPAAD